MERNGRRVCLGRIPLDAPARAAEGRVGMEIKSVYRMDKFSLPEGDVIIHFPYPLSSDSQVWLEDYLAIFVRKMKRWSTAIPVNLKDEPPKDGG